ncbi:MAG: pyruvate synthase [Dehalococcoidia bacterium]|jgi:pyruvate ferredoxin oxidoreductase delta subunit|nr:pyruvate synthase [Dehalococcoidia bacterium]MDP7239832.1 pyruvate synthase [Dehalococcoidia bacterium]MDP7470040.1 pyruvate synthase [Dehalococcoidia bacterium]
MKITMGCVAQPGTSQNNNTGSWRTGLKPRFLHLRCTACDLCSLACPDGCIYGNGNNTYFADLKFCKGCGICCTVCPVNDIEMVPEEMLLEAAAEGK